jgi:hypothetical protein
MKRRYSTGIALGILVGALSGAAWAQSVVTKTDSTSGYFDESSGLRSFVVTAADMATGTAVHRVTIAIDFEKFDGETLGRNFGDTPFYNEIVFTLTNPQNVTTTLIDAYSFNVGAGGFRGVLTFDDLAAQFVNVDPDAPHTGTFKPTGPNTLGSLNSARGVGVWTLGIEDTFRFDHLGYYSATLKINEPRQSSHLTPEVPGSVQAGAALLSLGACALCRRRLRVTCLLKKKV